MFGITTRPRLSRLDSTFVRNTPVRGLLRRHPDFRRVWAANAISEIGSRLSLLAFPLLALLTLHATAFEVSLLRALATAAWLALGLVAGAWMDRIRVRGVMIAADAARAVILATVPIAYLAGVLTLAQLYAVALLAGVGTVCFGVAAGTYLPRLLSTEDLVEGNARLATNTSVAAVLASGGGGFLIQWLTAPIAIAVDALSFVWSAVWLRGVRHGEPAPPRPERPHLRREIAEGWGFVWRHRILRPLAGYAVCTIFFQAMNDAVWLTYLVRRVGLSPWVIGLVSMSGLVGAVIAGLVATRIAQRLGNARALVLGSCLYAVGFGLYPLTTAGWGLTVAVVGSFLVSFTIIVNHVLQVSARQSLCPKHLYGRVGATSQFMTWGIMPIGALAGGVLATVTSTHAALWIAAVGIAVSILWMLLSPLRLMRDIPAPAAAAP